MAATDENLVAVRAELARRNVSGSCRAALRPAGAVAALPTPFQPEAAMTTTTTTFPQLAASSSTRTFARYATIGARCALGFVFFSAGLMGLLNVMPPPASPCQPASCGVPDVFRGEPRRAKRGLVSPEGIEPSTNR